MQMFREKNVSNENKMYQTCVKYIQIECANF